MTTTQQDTKKMVRAYTEINRPQAVSVIAHALDLTVAEVQHALDTQALTATRKADRATMAKQVADLARNYGFKAETSGDADRKTSVSLMFYFGLRLTLRFDGHSPAADTYVLSWHGVDEGVQLRPAMFRSVNSCHGHKATDVARGFDDLITLLAARFASIADGSAYVIMATQ